MSKIPSFKTTNNLCLQQIQQPRKFKNIKPAVNTACNKQSYKRHDSLVSLTWVQSYKMFRLLFRRLDQSS
jgi:hypothetical protein